MRSSEFLLYVVFDNYHVSTTKEPEQKQRLSDQPSSYVSMEKQASVPGKKGVFLSNKKNKQNLINLIADYLAEAEI